MLKDSLFTIISSAYQENNVHSTLQLNKDNEIFAGHFPGHPVLPGACMLQMLKDVLEQALGLRLRLKKADNIKFLSLVVPADNQVLQIDLSYSFADEKSVYVTASLTVQEQVCFKFKGRFDRG